jgi:toxin-antitoxin system PIN domain toxin
MSSESLVLADVNLWLATVVVRHPSHHAAATWWRERALPAGTRVAFCRLTQLGLLRLLTNETVMGRDRMTVRGAWDTYRQVLEQDAVTFEPEPAGLDETLDGLCGPGRSSRQFWSDAYLAAFAMAAGLRLVTFDAGFRRFTGLRLSVLA